MFNCREMKISLNSVLYFGICLFILSNTGSVLTIQVLDCGQNFTERADTEFSKLIAFTNPDQTFPESDNNSKVFCNEYNERIRILSDYVKKCKKGLPKQLLSVMMYTIRLQVKNLCKKKSTNRLALIAAGKCVNAAKQEFQKCNDQIISELLGVLKVEHKRKIPLTCCSYYKYIECYAEKGSAIQQCRPENLDEITGFIDGVAGNALSLLCGDYSDGSDKCSKLEPAPSADKKIKRPRSFFTPFVQVFDSFPEITAN